MTFNGLAGLHDGFPIRPATAAIARLLKTVIWLFTLACVLVSPATSRACIWDAQTMTAERLEVPDMAKVILGDPPAPPDPGPLRDRIK